MSDARITLYRIVLTDPPTLADFTSNRAKGKPRRRSEPEDQWAGLSMFDTAERAREMALAFPLGDYIAEVRLPPDAPIQVAKTRGVGHYTESCCTHALW